MMKAKGLLPDLIWLEDDQESEKFTFPQVSPSLLLQETPFSLDSKVPLIPALDDVMMLCTTKLGMKRFQGPQDADFDMRIPNNSSLDYNFLHDPHLKKYLGKPYVRKSLVNQGLVTEDGFVKCSPREFNEFRQWIRRLKLNSMEATARNIAEEKKDEDDDPPNKLTEHSIQVLELMKRKQFQAKQTYKQKKEKKIAERTRLMKNLEQECRNVEQKKKEKQKLRKMAYKQKEKELEQRKILFNCRERQIKSARIEQLSKKDEHYLIRKQELSEIRKVQRKDKEKEAIEKWKRRQSYCLKMMEEKKLQLEKERQERKKRMEQRKEGFEKGRRKMEKALDKSTQLSREKALKNMHLANSFLKNAETKKEAEIMRWREKYSTTAKKRFNITTPTKKPTDFEPIDHKEERDMKNARAIDASARNDDLDARLAMLDDSLSDQSLPASFKVQKRQTEVAEEMIPQIEVTECMESHDHDSSFLSEADEETRTAVSTDLPSSPEKASSTVMKPKMDATAKSPDEALSVSNIHPDSSVQSIARQVAKLALMRAAGQVDFDLHTGKSKSGSFHIGKAKKKDEVSHSHASVKMTRSADGRKVKKTRSSEHKLKSKESSRIYKSTDNLISTEANRLAENALENVMLTLGCEESTDDVIKGDGRSIDAITKNAHSDVLDETHSILLNGEDSVKLGAKQVTKQAIVGAAGDTGNDEGAVKQISEYIDSLPTKQSKKSNERHKEVTVRFDEDSVGSTPRNRPTSVSERVPTPHSSLTRLDQEESLDDAIAFDVDKAANSLERVLSSKGACKKLELQDSEDSFQSTDSAEKTEHVIEKGRRATPYFGKTEKKDIFSHIKGSKADNLMEAFGEEEEEENSEFEEQSYAASEETDFSKLDSSGSMLVANSSSQNKEHNDSRQTVSSSILPTEREDSSAVATNSEQIVRQAEEEYSGSQKGESNQGDSSINVKDDKTQKSKTLVSISSEIKNLSSKPVRELEENVENQNLPHKGRFSNALSVKKAASMTHNKRTLNDSNAEESARKSKSMQHEQGLRKKVSATFSSMLNINPSVLKSQSSTSKVRLSKRSVTNSKTATESKAQSVESASGNSLEASRQNMDSVESIEKQHLLKKDENNASKQMLDDQLSQKTVESTSSHLLPKVRKSMSRMMCNIDSSVYSAVSEEIGHVVSLNSQEILATTGEKETVVRIDQPSEDELPDVALDPNAQDLCDENVTVLSSQNDNNAAEELVKDHSIDNSVAPITNTVKESSESLNAPADTGSQSVGIKESKLTSPDKDAVEQSPNEATETEIAKKPEGSKSDRTHNKLHSTSAKKISTSNIGEKTTNNSLLDLARQESNATGIESHGHQASNTASGIVNSHIATSNSRLAADGITASAAKPPINKRVFSEKQLRELNQSHIKINRLRSYDDKAIFSAASSSIQTKSPPRRRSIEQDSTVDVPKTSANRMSSSSLRSATRLERSAGTTNKPEGVNQASDKSSLNPSSDSLVNRKSDVKYSKSKMQESAASGDTSREDAKLVVSPSGRLKTASSKGSVTSKRYRYGNETEPNIDESKSNSPSGVKSVDSGRTQEEEHTRLVTSRSSKFKRSLSRGSVTSSKRRPSNGNGPELVKSIDESKDKLSSGGTSTDSIKTSEKEPTKLETSRSNRSKSSTLKKSSIGDQSDLNKGITESRSKLLSGAASRKNADTQLKNSSSKNFTSGKQRSSSGDHLTESKSQVKFDSRSNESIVNTEDDSGNLVASVSSRFKPSASTKSFSGSKIYVAPVNPGLDFTASIRSGIQSGSSRDIGP